MESRDAQLHIRLTHEELEAIRKLRDETGLSYSQIVRAAIHANESGDPVHLVVFDRNTAPSIAREMRKWGHHYNQAVHALNRLAFYAERGSLKPDEAEAPLIKANENLEDVSENAKVLAKEVDRIFEYGLVRIRCPT